MKLIPFSALVGVNVALLLGIAVLWSVGSTNWAPPEASLPDHLSLRAPRIERVAAPAETLPQTLQRPLFAQTRRPPRMEVAAEVEPVAPDPLQDVVMLGIFTVGGEKHVMLRTNDKVSRLKAGDGFGSWTVAALGDKAATFVRGDERRQLELKHAAQPVLRAPPGARRPPVPPRPGVAPLAAPPEGEASNAIAPDGNAVENSPDDTPVPAAGQAPSVPVSDARRSARTLAEGVATPRGMR